MPELRIGGSIARQSTLLTTLTHPICHDWPCVQFFLGPETSCNIPSISPDDRRAVHQYCSDHNKTFAVHLSLTANLAAPKPHQVAYSRQHVRACLNVLTDLPAVGVLHIGKTVDRRSPEQGLAQVVDQLNQFGLLNRNLILENAAGQGTELGCNWNQLRHLYEGLDRQIGLCLDTQHAFASGLGHFQSHQGTIETLEALEAICPRSLRLIHLNDSKIPYQGRRDRHERIAGGYIWSERQEGLQALLDYARDKTIDLVLETPGETQAHDIGYLKQLTA